MMNSDAPTPTPEVVDRLIEYFRSFQSRTRMYLGEVDIASVSAWLNGFGTACHALGIRYGWAGFPGESVRGWKNECRGIVPQMREAGLSDERIIAELIEIELELLSRLNDGDAPQTN